MKKNKKIILLILFMMLIVIEPVNAATEWCTELESVFTLFGYVLSIAYVFTPIILIITGAITLIKALMEQNEGKIKKAQDVMIKKVISAVCVFVVVTLVRVIIKVVADDAWEDCANCFLNPRSCNLSVSLGNQDETLDGGTNALPTQGTSGSSSGTSHESSR